MNKRANPQSRSPRALRGLFAAAFACLVWTAIRPADGQIVPRAPTAPASSSTFATLQGFVIDSIHKAPLAGALVHVDGTTRNAMTTAEGRYLIDSIPPGNYRLALSHPLLDTIGLVMASPPIALAAGKVMTVDLAVPSSERLVSLLCPAAVLKIRGPAALIGFIRDPDTGGPALGSKVQLVFEEADPLGLKKSTRIREASVDSVGGYRICGLPTPMTGKVQVFRNGVSSGEVAASIDDGFLGLRSLSIVIKHAVVATVAGDSGKQTKVFRGSARVTGRVTNKSGQPLAGARVSLQGSGVTTITKPNGEFVLDSLPSGTQALEVRKLGYGAEEVALELASGAPQTVAVTMSDYVPTLETMRIEAERDKGLSDVGYLGRKHSGHGYYMDGDAIHKEALRFSDVMRTAPGIKVVPNGDGRTYSITSSRDPMGCVNFVIDGSKWQQMTPGDVDDYLRPDELRAIEIYSPSTTPAEFQDAGRSSCTTVVAWTVARTERAARKKK
jgi:hypothetical protein